MTKKWLFALALSVCLLAPGWRAFSQEVTDQSPPPPADESVNSTPGNSDGSDGSGETQEPVTYVCPRCGYETDEVGGCPACNIPLIAKGGGQAGGGGGNGGGNGVPPGVPGGGQGGGAGAGGGANAGGGNGGGGGAAGAAGGGNAGGGGGAGNGPNINTGNTNFTPNTRGSGGGNGAVGSFIDCGGTGLKLRKR